MKNKILILLLGIAIFSCDPKPSQECMDLVSADSKVMVWFFIGGAVNVR